MRFSSESAGQVIIEDKFTCAVCEKGYRQQLQLLPVLQVLIA